MFAKHSGYLKSCKTDRRDDWQEVPLASACIKVTDGSHSSPTPRNHGRPIANVKDLRPGFVDLLSCTKIAEEDFQSLVRNGCDVQRHDVLLSKDGTIGRVVVYEQNEPLVALSSIAILRPGKALDPFFLGQALQSSQVTKQIGVLAGGSALHRLVLRDINRILIPLPPLAEQQRIAAVLDTIDEAIAKTEAVITKLRQVRAGLLHDLLTRGLDEHGQLRDPIAHPEQFHDSPLGRTPREWRLSRFEEVLEGIDAGKSPDYPDQSAPPGDWGVLKVSAIWPEGFRPHENKWVTKAMHQVPTYQVRDGDLLISRSNTYELVGLVCLVRNAPPRLMLCDKTLRLRLKADRGINPFFALLLQTRTARSQIEINATGTSGSMKNISQDVIRALQLAYPKVEEQRRILAAVSPANVELDALGRELNKLVALKSGLMSDLLTGRVHVPQGVAVAS